jgi:hypothetical protein
MEGNRPHPGNQNYLKLAIIIYLATSDDVEGTAIISASTEVITTA